MNSPDPLRGKVAAQLTAMSMPGGPLHTKSDASTMIRFAASPAWLRFRRTVIDWCLARETPLREGRVAILMAGPPGASKSTAQAHMVGEHLQGWRHMDADEFELRLLAAADADGLLQQFLPVPVAELTAEFAAGASPIDVCARTIRTLRDLGVRHFYVSNLPLRRTAHTLNASLDKAGVLVARENQDSRLTLAHSVFSSQFSVQRAGHSSGQ